MKYTIEVGVRAQMIQLAEITKEEAEEYLSEDLDEIYNEVGIDSETYCNTYLGHERFSMCITDEDGNTIFETDDIDDYFALDKTYDDDGETLGGWKFVGLKDGYYMVRLTTVRGAGAYGDFDTDKPFDIHKLYIMQENKLDESLIGTLFQLGLMYYQQGKDYDIERDEIIMDTDYVEEQDRATYLARVEKDCWEYLDEDNFSDDDEDLDEDDED